jgi:ABC-type glutathione transport system ATPase component
VSKLNTTELEIEADKLKESEKRVKTLCECRDKDNGASRDTKSTVGLAKSIRESLTKSAQMDADDTTSLTISDARKEKEKTAFEWSNLHYKIPGADRLDQDLIDWCKHKVDTAKDDTAKDSAQKQLEKAKKHDKHIIQGCSGKLVQGQALCILGPSGAGKTSLLNMFTLECNGGKSYGSVKFNDAPISTEILSTYCGVVRQFEATWPHLTAKEALLYSISLYEDMDGTSAEIAERKTGLVTDALISMGLAACKDTRLKASQEARRNDWLWQWSYSRDPKCSSWMSLPQASTPLQPTT